MFGDHAEPDSTAKDVVHLALDNAWALQHIVQGNVKVRELILSEILKLPCKPRRDSRLPARWGERLSTWRGEGQAVGRKAVHLARGEKRWGERLSTERRRADRGPRALNIGAWKHRQVTYQVRFHNDTGPGL